MNPAEKPGMEDLEEALDEWLYKESNYFLKRDFLPKLAEKRINKLEPLCALSKQLDIPPRHAALNENDLGKVFDSDDLVKLVSAYNQKVSNFKLEITQTRSPCDIIDVYRVWKEVFLVFARRYCEIYENKAEPNLKSVKLRSSSIDFVELRNELESGNYTGKAQELYSILKPRT